MSGGPPEPIDPSFRIALPAFEGPLDLLLHLIQKHELEIIDLPIAFVTEQYLSYLGLMQRLNLDVAAEYLVMAATLAHIKSKLLLPTVPDGQEDELEDEIDPREELIRRLLEYQKYKLAAEDLGSRGVAGRDVFLRGAPAPEASGPAPLADMGVFKLLDAFQRVLARTKTELAFEITSEKITIQERMTELVEMLGSRKRVAFDDLFARAVTTYEIVVTFLAILEMAKMHLVRVYQSGPEAPLHLEHRMVSDGGEAAPQVFTTTSDESGAPPDTERSTGTFARVPEADEDSGEDADEGDLTVPDANMPEAIDVADELDTVSLFPEKDGPARERDDDEATPQKASPGEMPLPTEPEL